MIPFWKMVLFVEPWTVFAFSTLTYQSKIVVQDDISRWELLSSPITEEVKTKLKHVVLDSSVQDEIILGPSTTRIYSATFAYKSPESTVHSTSIVTWSWIWKLKLPANIIHFFWLAYHGMLPTNQYRHWRHFSIDMSCCRRGALVEDSLHALGDCTHSKRVWERLNFTQKPNFNHENFQEWLRIFATQQDEQLYASTCWQLWKSRNNSIFNDKDWPLRYIVTPREQLRTIITLTHP